MDKGYIHGTVRFHFTAFWLSKDRCQLTSTNGKAWRAAQRTDGFIHFDNLGLTTQRNIGVSFVCGADVRFLESRSATCV